MQLYGFFSVGEIDFQQDDACEYNSGADVADRREDLAEKDIREENRKERFERENDARMGLGCMLLCKVLYKPGAYGAYDAEPKD